MIISQGYPLWAISPSEEEYPIIGWVVTDLAETLALLAGYRGPVVIGRGEGGWRLAPGWEPFPFPFEDKATEEVKFCKETHCEYYGLRHDGGHTGRLR